MLVGFTCYLLAFSPAVRRAHTHFGSLLTGAQPGMAGAGSPRVQSVSLGCVPCPGEVPISLPLGRCSPLPAAAALWGFPLQVPPADKPPNKPSRAILQIKKHTAAERGARWAERY